MYDLVADVSSYPQFLPWCAACRIRKRRQTEAGEVIDADGDVIPGLYAAGRNASGLPAHGYNSGLSLADATFSGRLAGSAAAKRLG